MLDRGSQAGLQYGMHHLSFDDARYSRNSNWFKQFYSKTNSDVYKVSKEKSINKLALMVCSANSLHRITSI